MIAVGALVVVVVASVAMEQGASALGTHFGVPEIVVGGLVLAAVTSLPNAVSARVLGPAWSGCCGAQHCAQLELAQRRRRALDPSRGHRSGQAIRIGGAGCQLVPRAHRPHPRPCLCWPRAWTRLRNLSIIAAYIAFVVALLATTDAATGRTFVLTSATSDGQRPVRNRERRPSQDCESDLH